MKELSNKELAMFCDQVAMILKAGISPMEGVGIMLDDAASNEGRMILKTIAERCEAGESFYNSVSASGVFPKYALDMIQIGEQSGKLEEVMDSLAYHYNREEAIAEGIKNAVTYPFLIIGMMMIVIIVLVVKVLPLFDQVFAQLGSEISGFSKVLLNFGNTLTRYSVVFIAIFLILVACYFIFTKLPSGRKAFARFASKFFATRNFYNKIASGRFASGMAITMSAGLDTDESLKMVEELVDNESMKERVMKCRSFMEEGNSFSESLAQSGIFSNMYSKMINVGYKTGSVDKVLEKISQGYDSEIESSMSNAISIIEPTLVIILSVIVCLILLSVMMPLMGIMSSIG